MVVHYASIVLVRDDDRNIGVQITNNKNVSVHDTYYKHTLAINADEVKPLVAEFLRKCKFKQGDKFVMTVAGSTFMEEKMALEELFFQLTRQPCHLTVFESAFAPTVELSLSQFYDLIPSKFKAPVKKPESGLILACIVHAYAERLRFG